MSNNILYIIRTLHGFSPDIIEMPQIARNIQPVQGLSSGYSGKYYALSIDMGGGGIRKLIFKLLFYRHRSHQSVLAILGLLDVLVLATPKGISDQDGYRLPRCTL